MGWVFKRIFLFIERISRKKVLENRVHYEMGCAKRFFCRFSCNKKLKEKQFKSKLILTLNEDDTAFKMIANHNKYLISQLDLRNDVENKGDLVPDALQALYQSLDIFIFPSLCESFDFLW